MIRSEYEAQQQLLACSQRVQAGWLKPAPARIQTRRGLFARILRALGV